jgi:hypothetical protein
MFRTLKAKLTLVMAALLLFGGGILMSGPHRAIAQGGLPTPTATETCTAQDAAATAEPTQATDADNVDLQCSDQTTLDGQDSADAESSVEPTESSTDKGGDNVDQQGDHRDAGDTQPDTAGRSK